MARFLGILTSALIFLLAFASPSLAHKVTIFAWADGDTVFTESKFSGGRVVKDGKVEVLDANGTLLLEGRTNDNGEFSFQAPKKADLKILLTAGMGHQNSWKISAGELGEAKAPESSPAPDLIQKAVSPEAIPPASTAPGLTAKDMEEIVGRKLEEKIQPLTRMVAAMQDRGPSLNEIIGGIGYIIGLVGLGAYVRYRKDNRRS